jgi:hypothetical protein
MYFWLKSISLIEICVLKGDLFRPDRMYYENERRNTIQMKPEDDADKGVNLRRITPIVYDNHGFLASSV